MTDFLVEVAVISFTLGGVIGGIVALTLNTQKKSTAQTAAEEKAQDIFHL